MDIYNYVQQRLIDINQPNAIILHIQRTGSYLFFKNEAKDLDFIVIVSQIDSSEEYIYDTSKNSNGLVIDLFIYTLSSFQEEHNLNILNENLLRRKVYYGCFLLSNKDENVIYGGPINISYDFFNNKENYERLTKYFINSKENLLLFDRKAPKGFSWIIITLDCLKNNSTKPSLLALNIVNKIRKRELTIQQVRDFIEEFYMSLEEV